MPATSENVTAAVPAVDARRKRVLETSQLVKAFGGLIAVNKVDFHACENEIVGLIGPNGAGKTTLFNAITGVYPPDLRRRSCSTDTPSPACCPPR